MDLIVKEKTGFYNKSLSTPIVLLDYRKKPFYDSRIVSKPVQKFNLPKGAYIVQSGHFDMLKEPVKYRLIDLPRPERVMKDPFQFKIIFKNNPSKCTIFWDANTIVFDHKLKELSLPELFFILYHEYAHKLYETEEYTDWLAANMMLIKGYNPSQIGAAPITSLSERQGKRKEALVKKLINLGYES